MLPENIRAIGINSNVKHSVGGGHYGIARCASFMAHTMILSKMREMGAAAGKTLTRDPMNGYLANLDQEDYKRFFRPYLPEFDHGSRFPRTIRRHDRYGDERRSGNQLSGAARGGSSCA